MKRRSFFSAIGLGALLASAAGVARSANMGKIDRRLQELVRVMRVSESKYKTNNIADVRFVPLVGEQGWAASP